MERSAVISYRTTTTEQIGLEIFVGLTDNMFKILNFELALKFGRSQDKEHLVPFVGQPGCQVNILFQGPAFETMT
jgi:hypothetical protein